MVYGQRDSHSPLGRRVLHRVVHYGPAETDERSLVTGYEHGLVRLTYVNGHVLRLRHGRQLSHDSGDYPPQI